MKKIKLIDFLEFVNFRDYDGERYDTKIIRIEYPDKDIEADGFSPDRYFEYGIYDFSGDKRKRMIQTINPYILNCFVADVRVNECGILTIYVTTEKEIDADNLDMTWYDLDGYESQEKKEELIYICCSEEKKPLDLYKYCNFIIFKQIGIPVFSIINSVGDNNIEAELEKGVYENTDDRLISRCDKVFVFDEDETNRMKEIIDLANRLKIPVIYKKDFDFYSSLKTK